MKKLLLSFLLFILTVAATAQKSTGFSQKRQPHAVKDAGIAGFPTIGSPHAPPSNLAPRRIDYQQIKQLEIARDTTNGAVIYIRNLATPKPGSQLRVSAEKATYDFLQKNRNLLQLENPEKELQLAATTTDETGRLHLRLQQQFNGIPVYGGEMIAHVKDGFVESVNGRAFPTFELNTTPALTKEQAIATALQDVADKAKVKANSEQQILGNFQKNTAELMVYYVDNHPVLTYEMTIRPNLLERWIYYLNAQTGEVIDSYSHTCTLDGVFPTSAKDLNGQTRQFTTYQQGSTYFMLDTNRPMFQPAKSQLPDNPTGVIWTIDAKNSRIGSDMNLYFVTSTNASSWSPTAVSAQYNAGLCYEYYQKTHGRNSLNGQGGNITSVINITDEDGTGLDNAYWNGEFMGYGNGNTAFRPLAGSLDVAGHEMTHGVIENTSRLEYRNQSGAMNESFADIFGAMIDRDDWTLGEDVVKPGQFPSGALRSLQDPNQGGTSLRNRGYQPKNMSQYIFLSDTPDEDNGGVHINSGITNHAYYLFATNSSVGRDKAEKVYYDVLSNYLIRTSKFIDLRLAVIESAQKLYGSTVAAAARQAFDAVGIVETSGSQSQPEKTPDIQVNPGAESLVVYDPVEETLYAGVFSQNNFTQIAPNYGCLNKPSVTDDGSGVFFVGRDKHIYYKSLVDNSSPRKLSSSPVFRNVAISKDGKRLAALSAEADQYIYIFDLVGNRNVRFQLYNSTYSQGVSTGEVLYADSFEWDYTGEFLIYDALNHVSTTFGEVEYWDVGVLSAWNPVTNNFGTGTIEKIFTNLERGDNIGNPALSKTNPSIMAFDYFSDNDNAYYVVTVNFDTGEIKGIYENNDIGYPDYGKADNKLTFNSLQNSKNVVLLTPIASDRISPTGNIEVIFSDAKWAVWYAQGERKLPTKQGQTISFSTIPPQQPGATVTLNASASSGLGVQFSVVSGQATINGKQLTAGTTPGKVAVQAFQVGSNTFAPASAEQLFCILPPTPTIRQSGDNKVLTASGGQRYQWYVNGNPLGGQTTNPDLTVSATGVYTVASVTADGCESLKSQSITIGSPVLGIEPTEGELNIFPNPAADYIEIKLAKGTIATSVSCVNVTGQEVFQQVFSPKISTKHLPSGSYFLRLQTNKGELTKRFVKK